MSLSPAASHMPLLAAPQVRDIGTSDLQGALRAGYRDFMAMPSHLIFLGLIYPILGLVFASLAFGYDLLPLLFPLISGFALVGPLAGIGLYELSRRRELGLEPTWQDAFAVLQSPAIIPIVAMGFVLAVIFVLWLLSAHALYGALIGSNETLPYDQLLRTILTTPPGWALILIGNAVGLLFAVLVLTISVIAFPLILDRHASIGMAMAISRRAVLANPRTMAMWGLIVAALLVLGSIPLFVGLAIVLPILGHATWHLYRRVIVT